MATKQELNKFWEDMKKALSESNAAIDLDNPADLARIRIVSITDINTNTVMYDATATTKLAFVNDPDFDIDKATDEEILSKQVPGKPDDKKLEEMYNAAKEGKLVFSSLPEYETGPRQIALTSSGVKILPDISHISKEMEDAGAIAFKPQKPKLESAGFVNNFLAFFGNKKAKEKVAEVKKTNDLKMNLYRRNCELWDNQQKMDPELQKFAKAQKYIMTGYFSNPQDEIYEREHRMMEITEKFHKDDRLKKINDNFAENIRDKLAKATKGFTSDEPMPKEELKEAVAGYMILANEKQKMEKGINPEEIPGGISEASLDKYEKIAHFDKNAKQKESPEYRGAVKQLCSTSAFSKAFDELTSADFTRSDNLNYLHSKLCQEMISLSQEAKAPKIEQVEPVKTAAHDDLELNTQSPSMGI